MSEIRTSCEEYGHEFLYCCFRTEDTDPEMIWEHFVCSDCGDDYEA